jgi:hypothetical protein
MTHEITAETLEDWMAEVDGQIPPPLTNIIGNPVREEMFHRFFRERFLLELQRHPELQEELIETWAGWCSEPLL